MVLYFIGRIHQIVAGKNSGARYQRQPNPYADIIQLLFLGLNTCLNFYTEKRVVNNQGLRYRLFQKTHPSKTLVEIKFSQRKICF